MITIAILHPDLVWKREIRDRLVAKYGLENLNLIACSFVKEILKRDELIDIIVGCYIDPSHDSIVVQAEKIYNKHPQIKVVAVNDRSDGRFDAICHKEVEHGVYGECLVKKDLGRIIEVIDEIVASGSYLPNAP